MRLELIKNDFQNCECVSAKLSRDDPDVSCIGLFLKEMNDHTGVVASEYDITRGLFDAFSKSFVPDESRVYAVLTYIFPEEYRVVVEELRKSSLKFLVSPVALPDWIDDLARVSIGTIDKDFLRKEGRVIYNCFEHGMELMGLDESTESLQVAAEELSRKFNVPLRVVERRE